MLAVGERLLSEMTPLCVRMTTGFGGGVGGSREELCGAFSAGAMIIGGLYGRTQAHEDSQKAYDLVKELRRRFQARWQTLTCAPIRDWAKGPAGPAGGCAFVVAESARLLLALLDEMAEAHG